MYKPYKMVKGLVMTNPLPLMSEDRLVYSKGITDNLIRYINSIFTRDIGIEIEAILKSNYSIDDFHEAWNNANLACSEDSDDDEIRIRLNFYNNSISRCLIDLYLGLEIIKKYYKLNMRSGIHYHVDCPTIFLNSDIRYDANIVSNQHEWVFKALSSWNYNEVKGGNARQISVCKWSQVRIHTHHKTLEYRIGEMTFDYSLILKRIVHVTNITNKIVRIRDKYNKNKIA